MLYPIINVSIYIKKELVKKDRIICKKIPFLLDLTVYYLLDFLQNCFLYIYINSTLLLHN